MSALQPLKSYLGGLTNPTPAPTPKSLGLNSLENLPKIISLKKFFFKKGQNKYAKSKVYVPITPHLSPWSHRQGPHPLALLPFTGNSGHFWSSLRFYFMGPFYTHCLQPRGAPQPSLCLLCTLRHMRHKKHSVGTYYVSALSLQSGHMDSFFAVTNTFIPVQLKQAHVGRTLTTGRHLLNGSLCDLEGTCTQIHALNICSRPPSPRERTVWR